METTLNLEGTLGKEIQHLVALLVKQQVQKELQLLEKTLLSNAEHNISKEQKTEIPAETVSRTASSKIQAEAKEPKIICTEKLKRLIKEMTPAARRRTVPLLVQARMLAKLYEHREYGMPPEALFSYAGTGKRAGQRYISFFKDRGVLTFTGARQNGKYILTYKGIDLVEKL